MKIGFTGAGGTGKSTVLEHLLSDAKFTQCPPVLRSTTRQVYERWGIDEAAQERMTPEDRYRLQNDIFENRLANEQNYKDGFISDRTLLCNYAYCVFRNYTMIGNEEFAALEGKVAANLMAYDVLIYFPMYFTPAPDGMRQDGNAYNASIDGLIFRFLNKHSIPHTTLQMGSPQDRAEAVRDLIDGVTPNKVVNRFMSKIRSIIR